MNLINGLRAFARRSKKLLTKLRLKKKRGECHAYAPPKNGLRTTLTPS